MRNHALAALAVASLALSILPPLRLSAQDLRYRSIGPARGGRVTAVTGVPGQPGTFYMGATGGGVWKTEDCGILWRPISDGQIATGSIGSIAVPESNPNIVYVGTGSAAIRSNVLSFNLFLASASRRFYKNRLQGKGKNTGFKRKPTCLGPE